MSDSNVYGAIWSKQAVEKRVIGSLEDWLTYYLGEQERIDGWEPDSIARPEGIIRMTDLAKWPEDKLPLLVVSCGEAIPKKHENGRYEATFPTAIGMIVSDLDREGSRDLADSYAAAVRGAVVQHKSMKSTAFPDGINGSVQWARERYDGIATSDSSTLAASAVNFDVTINNAITAQAGPRTLPETPPDVDPGDWPTLKPGQPTAIVNPVEVLP